MKGYIFIHLQCINFVVNPSSRPYKVVISITPIFQSRVVQLADIFSWEKVIWEADGLVVALLNTRKPFHADIGLKHMPIKKAVLNCKTRFWETNAVNGEKYHIQQQPQVKHHQASTKITLKSKFRDESEKFKEIFI